MNITKTEALVLQQLVATAGSKLYGLEMVKASEGALKMGTIYVLLGRLEDKGFVTSHREELKKGSDQVVPRRFYEITGTGKRVLHAFEAAKAAYAHGLTGAL